VVATADLKVLKRRRVLNQTNLHPGLKRDGIEMILSEMKVEYTLGDSKKETRRLYLFFIDITNDGPSAQYPNRMQIYLTHKEEDAFKKFDKYCKVYRCRT